MVFDECTEYPVPEDEARESMRRSLRWASRSRAAFDALKDGDPGSDAALLRDRPGQRLRRPEARVPVRSRRHRFRRLRARRARGRRTGSAAARNPRDDGAGIADAAPALPHGRRHARRSRQGRGPRHGHVRLRHSDAPRTQRPAIHERRSNQYPQQPFPGRYGAARPRVRLLHLPQLLACLSAPSGTSATRFWARASQRCTTFITTRNSWPRCVPRSRPDGSRRSRQGSPHAAPNASELCHNTRLFRRSISVACAERRSTRRPSDSFGLN